MRKGVIFTAVAGTRLRPLNVGGFKQMMPVANNCEPVLLGNSSGSIAGTAHCSASGLPTFTRGLSWHRARVGSVQGLR